MNVNWIFFIYTGAVCLSSLYYHQSPQPLLLLLAAAAYTLSLLKTLPSLPERALQLSLLVTFHYFSASGWILILYYLHMSLLAYRFHRLWVALLVNSGLITAFTAITLIHNPPGGYDSAVPIVFTAVSCLLLSFLFRTYVHDIERQKQRLSNEKKHLSTHDALTGLYNFQEFHKQLELLAGAGHPFILVLIDCKDLKSLNTTNGFQGVNRILKQAAQLLRIMFPDASLISRYGGDEFALVVRTEDVEESHQRMTQLLSSEFPRLAAIEVNFGMACYPQEGRHKDDLILVAEHNLYLMKRDSWLKREEHMLRSEKLRVVGELASGMAHEIRNPLTTVKGFLQISKAGNYNVEPWYDLIMDEINRMSMLTAEFLQFSRPHVTQYKIQSITGCINRIIQLLESESTRLGHEIRFVHGEDELHMLMDQDKMLQLLLNLVKNAYEAMPEQGFVDIILGVRDGMAVIEIADNGKGIPDTELDKIFIPFYTTKDSGTGLGLSICHKIVQDHEGVIEVESVQGLGTKFTITLPLTEAEEPSSRPLITTSRPTISV
ncbi:MULTISPECIES: sensor histidine kinase [Paenibacillus]|uniref:sensor histidine kinase n=1 Tax=Paenibacillus TaxID=44249 RepID=UPI0022B9215F|nr:ATP-binding protein [Paenibacillus caseinilyticus]MCZ8518916.1 ATP-binding protein [Paenibacillus caseinilyticus]